MRFFFFSRGVDCVFFHGGLIVFFSRGVDVSACKQPKHTCFALGERGLQDRMTHAHARSDCVLTREGRLTD